ncbi:C4-dicarboxylate ABC transporter permease [Steroidobacter agaridevorans]|uniref:TRAP transporter large permease protein n=1 Tax=Steroidobacter agaridevorans TaxID=2695856 RepID=A0A829Y9B5_9GAMM|nr:TRAP transporter large permease [Steroidobacter agaridevorans]GFE79448.1 C4-dicarboxylate ABC transporter permease [Steroidobacter agaridevorans]
MIDWILGILALLALLVAGVPIALAMTIVALVGMSVLLGVDPTFAMLGQVFYDNAMSYTLSVMPLFVLMGNFVVKAGLADDLYEAANAWLRHYRGGLAMATIVACGGFSSVCGSSLATAATTARVSMPAMRRYGYSDGLATGTIAAGGTLGILIPPSIVLVIYGVITQSDIGKLFLAGILPGVVGIIGYLVAVRLSLLRSDEHAQEAEPLPWSTRLRATRGIAGVLILFVGVIGGIYLGAFTANEAAGVGAFGAFVLALLRRRLDRAALYEILVETSRMTAMLFFVLFGGILFANFVNVAGLPADLNHWITLFGADPVPVILMILAIYLLLGMVLESISMVLLTVPIFFPIVTGLGFDAIWFGIFVVVAVEISLITPPVGLNVFVLKAVLPEVPTRVIFRGVLPFVLIDVVRILLLIGVPSIALLIPATT